MTPKLDIVGLEHLHLHTTVGSVLDGFGEPEEYATHWKGHGDYLCISEHGTLTTIPRQIKACEATNKKDDPNKNKELLPIFAMEAYVNPLQKDFASKEEREKYQSTLSPTDKAIFRKSYHLLMIAKNEIGYRNLVRLSSWGWLHGLYDGKPRINHEQLIANKEGLIFTSCCYNSEIGQAYDKGGEEAGFAMIEKYNQMFKGSFYLEIMLLDFQKQKPYNKFILKAHDKYGIPIEITQDVHYLAPGDSKFQSYMLMMKKRTNVQAIEKKQEEGKDVFEIQDPNLWMKTEEELNEKWYKDYQDIDYDLFNIAKANTVEICKQCAGITLDRSLKLPKLENANERLKEEMIKGFMLKGVPKNGKYLSRLKEEYELICEKEFASYFLILKQMLDEARRKGPEILGWGTGREVVSPGRGSCVSSLVCYCLDITDVDPVHHGLVFSRFLSKSRGGKSMKLRF